MQPEPVEHRRELRFLIEEGATVLVNKDGRLARATTVNMSGFGVLLQFEEEFPLEVGDWVNCEFMVLHDTDKALPYWAVGDVVRIEGHRAAVDFKAGGYTPLVSKAEEIPAREP